MARDNCHTILIDKGHEDDVLDVYNNGVETEMRTGITKPEHGTRTLKRERLSEDKHASACNCEVGQNVCKHAN